MMFSSRPPFNDDPEPYFCRAHDARGTEYECAVLWPSHDRRHDPRPEYDRPQHNPTSTLLHHFRMIDGGRGEYADWLRDINENPELWRRRAGHGLMARSMVGYTDEEIDHARRVLTRLANLAKESKHEDPNVLV